MSLSVFGFQAMWSPYFFVFVLALTVLYFLLIGPLRSRYDKSEPATTKQIFLFTTAMVLLYIFKGGPMDLLGHLIFSAHMGQMAVLYLVIPPLVILGTPAWILRSIVHFPIIKPVMKFLTKPLIALIVFNGVFSFYHIPLIFDVVKTDMLLHAITTAILFIAAFVMWWPLVNPLEEWETLSGIKKIGYIFADGILLTPACALIIFADTPLYTTYTDPSAWVTALELCVPASMLATLDLGGPEMFNFMPPLEDQRTGGVIMKIIQEIVYGSILGYVFYQWVRKERDQDELEVQSYQLNPNSTE